MKLNFITKLFKKSEGKSVDPSNKNIKQDKPFDENCSKAFIDSGKIKALNRNYREAINDFSKAIELDPDSAESYLERSKAKRGLNDKSGADRDLETASRVLDNLDEGLKAYDNASRYYDNEDYKNAIRSYNKAINLLPSLTDVYYNRGISKQMLNDFDGAFDDFSKGIALNASNKAEAYYQRSKINRKQKNNEGALDDLNQAIILNPNQADYYYSRAILVDEYDALQDLNKAIELVPNDANNYIARSLRRKAMEDLEGSIVDLTKYIELNPKDGILTLSETYSLRATMKLSQNKLEASLLDHNKAVEADSSNEKALVERGIVKDLLHDFDGAIVDFSTAIELNPSYADAYYHRGVVRQNIGLEDEGIFDVIKAKTLGFRD